MKLADLPKAVIDDLCQDEHWRLDIEPGFDSKHEFWMVWRHFIALYHFSMKLRSNQSSFPLRQETSSDFRFGASSQEIGITRRGISFL